MATERAVLLRLHRDALRYFLDCQLPCGLVLDRQANFGPLRSSGLCSLTATGMGMIALALACEEPHRLLSRGEAVLRARGAAMAALALPHTRGVLPHFVTSSNRTPQGVDARSTIDTAWLVAGALAASALLNDPELERLAARLHERVDWDYWTKPDGSIAHGQDGPGRFLGAGWDRFNGETVLLYALAAGRSSRVRRPADRPTSVAGFTFPSAELGLFVSQYGLEMLDLRGRKTSNVPDLIVAAGLAADANRAVCRAHAGDFRTYRHFWGLSAGDGPADGAREAYRAYAPEGPIDGTAHITATLASIAHRPAWVWENLYSALRFPLPLRGRYGFSNVNLDRGWTSPDVVGIDLGMAALALDHCLFNGRVRTTFSALPDLVTGLGRLGFGHSRARAA
jgi:hypothetical protein